MEINSSSLPSTFRQREIAGAAFYTNITLVARPPAVDIKPWQDRLIRITLPLIKGTPSPEITNRWDPTRLARERQEFMNKWSGANVNNCSGENCTMKFCQSETESKNCSVRSSCKRSPAVAATDAQGSSGSSAKKPKIVEDVKFKTKMIIVRPKERKANTEKSLSSQEKVSRKRIKSTSSSSSSSSRRYKDRFAKSFNGRRRRLLREKLRELFGPAETDSEVEKENEMIDRRVPARKRRKWRMSSDSGVCVGDSAEDNPPDSRDNSKEKIIGQIFPTVSEESDDCMVVDDPPQKYEEQKQDVLVVPLRPASSLECESRLVDSNDKRDTEVLSNGDTNLGENQCAMDDQSQKCAVEEKDVSNAPSCPVPIPVSESRNPDSNNKTFVIEISDDDTNLTEKQCAIEVQSQKCAEEEKDVSNVPLRPVPYLDCESRDSNSNNKEFVKELLYEKQYASDDQSQKRTEGEEDVSNRPLSPVSFLDCRSVEINSNNEIFVKALLDSDTNLDENQCVIDDQPQKRIEEEEDASDAPLRPVSFVDSESRDIDSPNKTLAKANPAGDANWDEKQRASSDRSQKQATEEDPLNEPLRPVSFLGYESRQINSARTIFVGALPDSDTNLAENPWTIADQPENHAEDEEDVFDAPLRPVSFVDYESRDLNYNRTFAKAFPDGDTNPDEKDCTIHTDLSIGDTDSGYNERIMLLTPPVSLLSVSSDHSGQLEIDLGRESVSPAAFSNASLNMGRLSEDNSLTAHDNTQLNNISSLDLSRQWDAKVIAFKNVNERKKGTNINQTNAENSTNAPENSLDSGRIPVTNDKDSGNDAENALTQTIDGSQSASIDLMSADEPEEMKGSIDERIAALTDDKSSPLSQILAQFEAYQNEVPIEPADQDKDPIKLEKNDDIEDTSTKQNMLEVPTEDDALFPPPLTLPKQTFRVRHHRELGSRWCPTPLDASPSTSHTVVPDPQALPSMVPFPDAWQVPTGNSAVHPDSQMPNYIVDTRMPVANSYETSFTHNPSFFTSYAGPVENAPQANTNLMPCPMPAPPQNSPQQMSHQNVPTTTEYPQAIIDLMRKIVDILHRLLYCLEYELPAPSSDREELLVRFKREQDLVWIDLGNLGTELKLSNYSKIVKRIIKYYNHNTPSKNERILNVTNVTHILELKVVPPGGEGNCQVALENPISATHATGTIYNAPSSSSTQTSTHQSVAPPPYPNSYPARQSVAPPPYQFSQNPVSESTTGKGALASNALQPQPPPPVNTSQQLQTNSYPARQSVAPSPCQFSQQPIGESTTGKGALTSNALQPQPPPPVNTSQQLQTNSYPARQSVAPPPCQFSQQPIGESTTGKGALTSNALQPQPPPPVNTSQQLQTNSYPARQSVAPSPCQFSQQPIGESTTGKGALTSNALQPQPPPPVNTSQQLQTNSYPARQSVAPPPCQFSQQPIGESTTGKGALTSNALQPQPPPPVITSQQLQTNSYPARQSIAPQPYQFSQHPIGESTTGKGAVASNVLPPQPPPSVITSQQLQTNSYPTRQSIAPQPYQFSQHPIGESTTGKGAVASNVLQPQPPLLVPTSQQLQQLQTICWNQQISIYNYFWHVVPQQIRAQMNKKKKRRSKNKNCPPQEQTTASTSQNEIPTVVGGFSGQTNQRVIPPTFVPNILSTQRPNKTVTSAINSFPNPSASNNSGNVSTLNGSNQIQRSSPASVHQAATTAVHIPQRMANVDLGNAGIINGTAIRNSMNSSPYIEEQQYRHVSPVLTNQIATNSEGIRYRVRDGATSALDSYPTLRASLSNNSGNVCTLNGCNQIQRMSPASVHQAATTSVHVPQRLANVDLGKAAMINGTAMGNPRNSSPCIQGQQYRLSSPVFTNQIAENAEEIGYRVSNGATSTINSLPNYCASLSNNSGNVCTLNGSNQIQRMSPASVHQAATTSIHVPQRLANVDLGKAAMTNGTAMGNPRNSSLCIQEQQYRLSSPVFTNQIAANAEEIGYRVSDGVTSTINSLPNYCVSFSNNSGNVSTLNGCNQIQRMSPASVHQAATTSVHVPQRLANVDLGKAAMINGTAMGNPRNSSPSMKGQQYRLSSPVFTNQIATNAEEIGYQVSYGPPSTINTLTNYCASFSNNSGNVSTLNGSNQIQRMSPASVHQAATASVHVPQRMANMDLGKAALINGTAMGNPRNSSPCIEGQQYWVSSPVFTNQIATNPEEIRYRVSDGTTSAINSFHNPSTSSSNNSGNVSTLNGSNKVQRMSPPSVYQASTASVHVPQRMANMDLGKAALINGTAMGNPRNSSPCIEGQQYWVSSPVFTNQIATNPEEIGYRVSDGTTSAINSFHNPSTSSSNNSGNVSTLNGSNKVQRMSPAFVHQAATTSVHIPERMANVDLANTAIINETEMGNPGNSSPCIEGQQYFLTSPVLINQIATETEGIVYRVSVGTTPPIDSFPNPSASSLNNSGNVFTLNGTNKIQRKSPASVHQAAPTSVHVPERMANVDLGNAAMTNETTMGNPRNSSLYTEGQHYLLIRPVLNQIATDTEGIGCRVIDGATENNAAVMPTFVVEQQNQNVRPLSSVLFDEIPGPSSTDKSPNLRITPKVNIVQSKTGKAPIGNHVSSGPVVTVGNVVKELTISASNRKADHNSKSKNNKKKEKKGDSSCRAIVTPGGPTWWPQAGNRKVSEIPKSPSSEAPLAIENKTERDESLISHPSDSETADESYQTSNMAVIVLDEKLTTNNSTIGVEQADNGPQLSILDVQSISKDLFNSIETGAIREPDILSSTVEPRIDEDAEKVASSDETDGQLEVVDCIMCGKRSSVACEQCQEAFYCSSDCHEKHWIQEHHRTCKPLF